MNKILKIVSLTWVLLLTPITLIISAVPHAVTGTIIYTDSTSPDSVSWQAYITSRPEDTLFFNPPSLYDAPSGGFLLQCAGFSTWSAGDTLRVEIHDYNKAIGRSDQVLTHNPADDAGFIVLEIPTVSGMGHANAPEEFQLLQNYPNPFNPETMIVYQLNTSQFVSIQVFNSMGQKVKTLVSGYNKDGLHRVVWSGDADHGGSVSGGVYFIVLSGETFSKQIKATLLK